VLPVVTVFLSCLQTALMLRAYLHLVSNSAHIQNQSSIESVLLADGLPSSWGQDGVSGLLDLALKYKIKKLEFLFRREFRTTLSNPPPEDSPRVREE